MDLLCFLQRKLLSQGKSGWNFPVLISKCSVSFSVPSSFLFSRLSEFKSSNNFPAWKCVNASPSRVTGRQGLVRPQVSSQASCRGRVCAGEAGIPRSRLQGASAQRPLGALLPTSVPGAFFLPRRSLPAAALCAGPRPLPSRLQGRPRGTEGDRKITES